MPNEFGWMSKRAVRWNSGMHKSLCSRDHHSTLDAAWTCPTPNSAPSAAKIALARCRTRAETGE
eukprot:scaffold204861_cov34-Tisochrysis_lutea.AAC.7